MATAGMTGNQGSQNSFVSRNWRDLIRPRKLEVDAESLTPTYGRFTFDYYRVLAPGPPKPLVYGEWEPGMAYPAPSAGHRTWLVVSSVGSTLPGAREALQDLKSERDSYYVLEDQRFNSLEVWLFATWT